MARVKAITSFDHNDTPHNTGDEFDVSEVSARELAAAKLVRVIDGVTKPANKMAPDAAPLKNERPQPVSKAVLHTKGVG